MGNSGHGNIFSFIYAFYLQGSPALSPNKISDDKICLLNAFNKSMLIHLCGRWHVAGGFRKIGQLWTMINLADHFAIIMKKESCKRWASNSVLNFTGILHANLHVKSVYKEYL